MANPLLGLLFHWLGGLASASFYVPYRAVRGWSWEIYWLTGGVFSWLVGPWLFAFIQTPDLLAVLAATPKPTLLWCWVFGVLWGLGGLTFGLTMRYLGLSLGMAIVLGLTTAFGTLIPPLFDGSFADKLLITGGGHLVLAGIVVTLAGIAVVALAGHRKETELSAEDSRAVITEFDLKKGVLVAVFSGVMSSCFAFGLAAGQPIRDLALAHGAGTLWQGLPVLCVVLVGGFTTNVLWCLALIVKNRSAGQWAGQPIAAEAAAGAPDPTPLLRNYLLCVVAGFAWYFQFFFYTMGESQMGRYSFSSWTLHMASIIIFSTLWGFALKEWRGSSARTQGLVWLGVAGLVGATVIIGLGNMVSARG
ncbi:MAG: RhaT l-rhamnose-proton symport 2 [Caulobacter sp.]|nr:RhaT l-rhamnose-proton symport 2 [Caulobacter sp.]